MNPIDRLIRASEDALLQLEHSCPPHGGSTWKTTKRLRLAIEAAKSARHLPYKRLLGTDPVQMVGQIQNSSYGPSGLIGPLPTPKYEEPHF